MPPTAFTHPGVTLKVPAFAPPAIVTKPVCVGALLSVNVPLVATTVPLFNTTPLNVPLPVIRPVLVTTPDKSMPLFMTIVTELVTVPAPVEPIWNVALLVITPKFERSGVAVVTPLTTLMNAPAVLINAFEIKPPVEVIRP